MKKQLLMKMLLAVALLGGNVSVWASTSTTYDFTKLSQNSSTLTFTNSTTCYAETHSYPFGVVDDVENVLTLGGVLASYTSDLKVHGTYGIYSEHGRYIAVLNLTKGAKVSFTYRSADAESSSLTYYTSSSYGSASIGASSLIVSSSKIASGDVVTIKSGTYLVVQPSKNARITSMTIVLPETQVEIDAAIATTGNSTFTISSAPKGGDEVISVYGIKATFGGTTEETWTHALGNDSRGWVNQGAATVTNNLPTAKTFMKYEPVINGNLTVSTYLFTDATDYHVYLSDGTSIVEDITCPKNGKEGSLGGNGTYPIAFSSELQAGTTYYVYFSKQSSKGVESYVSGFWGFTFTPTNTIVGALDYSTINRGETHDLATLSDGDVYKVTFQNHGSNGAYKNNFVAYIKNSSSTIVAGMYADWYDWVADPTGSSASSAVTFTSPYATSMDGGLTLPASCWTNYYTDMADCPVDLTFSYSGGTLRIAGTATKDDHIYYYNYAYSGLEGDVTVGLSVCAAWLEVLSTASSASVSGTIASSGYSTIAVPYALDLSSATGIDAAYVVTKTTTEEVTLTSIATAVPAGTPLILKGTGSAAYSIPVVATGTAPETNYLSAAIVPTGIAANAAYILQSGEFHKVTEASTVPASKAYLLGTNVPAGARALTFTFGDEASGVEEIENEKMNIENGIYDLQGRRVNSQFFDEQSGRAERTSHNSQLNKGLYIVNGKKVIK